MKADAVTQGLCDVVNGRQHATPPKEAVVVTLRRKPLFHAQNIEMSRSVESMMNTVLRREIETADSPRLFEGGWGWQQDRTRLSLAAPPAYMICLAATSYLSLGPLDLADL